jgi:hypothetical protein
VTLETSSAVKNFWLDLTRTIFAPRGESTAIIKLTSRYFPCNSSAVLLPLLLFPGTNTQLPLRLSVECLNLRTNDSEARHLLWIFVTKIVSLRGRFYSLTELFQLRKISANEESENHCKKIPLR